MMFPLEALSAAIAARTVIWARLALRWQTGQVQPNHDKPVASAVLESSAWLVEVMIWGTREAELATVRLADDRIVNSHYDLSSRDDLEAPLDELVGLLAANTVPGAAVVACG
ncbi:hypothetical protein DLJ46_05210 [Micromonospora globispora]|uniref:Uncharacterized protein n=1 Tax=Micromonospora globispora TaxID=1450148 RepID=A0A317KDI5_9ACTN|nr:hypothetical protein DLJ46_05210 [Micromonospora globispora]RQW82002.1 hypothetical protein DKL51_34010 [Micromonospora globispora]